MSDQQQCDVDQADGQDAIWVPATVLIERIHEETPGVATLELRTTDPQAGYQSRPGQFNMLYLPGVGEVPMSISGDCEDATGWIHTVRFGNNATRAIAELVPGDSLGLRGPFGVGWPIRQCQDRDIVLVAGGMGLAGLRSTVLRLLRGQGEFGRVTLLYAARSADDILYRDQFTGWMEQGLAIQATVDRSSPGWIGHVGPVSLLVERLEPLDTEKTLVLVAGPEPMARHAIDAALARGVPDTQVWVALERNMHCGVGLCGHCQLGSHVVCTHGPMFRYDRIAAHWKVEAL